MSEKANHILKAPPQNLDAEKALLGSIMLRADSVFEILEIVKAESFYSGKHQKIFRAVVEIYSKGSPVDMLTLSAYLKDKKELEEIGGESYLAELATSVPTAANIEYYGKIVAEKYIKRRLIEASEKISQIAFDEEEDVEKSIDSAEKEIFKISTAFSSADFYEMERELKDAYERLERLQEGKETLRGLPTGFPSLDQKLSGFQKSDLIILAARPSVGKTSLALDIARKVAVDHKKSVAFFSLEMSRGQLIDRIMAAQAKVDSWKIRTGNLNENVDFGPLQEAISVLSEAKIFINDSSYNNILRMKSAARKLMRKKGLDLIIVDYLQLMAPLSKNANNSTVQEVTEISRGLKQLAKELDIPVLALSQLSRNIEHRGTNAEPRLADLRDSGSIEQDADLVMFLHRDKSEEEGKSKQNSTKLMIEKHRNGATGSIELYFDEKLTSFTEVEKSRFEDFESKDDEVEEF